MLRITTIANTPDQLHLQLEGRLVAAWVNELLLACEQRESTTQLDASGLSYADSTGVNALRQLLRREVRLVNCSPFITELLRASNHAEPE